VSTADGAAQRQAVSQARAAFERWVQAVHGEFVTFQGGDHHGAVTASLGPDRALRKTYEQSLARAQALGASSIRSARSSVGDDPGRLPAGRADHRQCRRVLACPLDREARRQAGGHLGRRSALLTVELVACGCGPSDSMSAVIPVRPRFQRAAACWCS